PMRTTFVLLRWLIVAAGLAATLLPSGLAQQGSKPYKVTIVEEKRGAAENVMALDAKVRIWFNLVPMGPRDKGIFYQVNAEDVSLGQFMGTTFMIDGALSGPTLAKDAVPIPQGPGRKRQGSQVEMQQGDIHITQSLEVVPGKDPQAKPGMVQNR